MVSLGAALENLVVAARAYGLQPTVRYQPNEGARGAVAEVTWNGGGPRRDRELFGALTDRRTNRRNYDGRGLMPQVRAQLSAQVADGPRLHWLDGRDALRELADLVHDAVHAQVWNRRIQTEQHAWLRASLQDAVRRGDGVPVDALGMSGPANWFAGRYYDPDSWFLRFGAGSLAKRAREGVRSAGAAALLTTTARDCTGWMVTTRFTGWPTSSTMPCTRRSRTAASRPSSTPGCAPARRRRRGAATACRWTRSA
jgi:hypothetical protein